MASTAQLFAEVLRVVVPLRGLLLTDFDGPYVRGRLIRLSRAFAFVNEDTFDIYKQYAYLHKLWQSCFIRILRELGGTRGWKFEVVLKCQMVCTLLSAVEYPPPIVFPLDLEHLFRRWFQFRCRITDCYLFKRPVDMHPDDFLSLILRIRDLNYTEVISHTGAGDYGYCRRYSHKKRPCFQPSARQVVGPKRCAVCFCVRSGTHNYLYGIFCCQSTSVRQQSCKRYLSSLLTRPEHPIYDILLKHIQDGDFYNKRLKTG